MALEALCVTDPVRKAYALQSLWARLEARDPGLRIDTEAVIADPGDLPGRPERPPLVPAVEVPQRSPFTPQGRAALLHAIAHIEFNAQNLAADAVFRFSGLPEAFYIDWMRVAAEEAKHYLLLAGHLATLGHAYGDFPAHDGLWTMTWKTREDFVARMALVPRTLEARGLDATPLIQAKLRRAGDLRAVEILDVILREEIGHVAIGNHWYRWACEREGLEPVSHYRELVRQYVPPRLRPPFNRQARLDAGFSETELAWLESGSPTDVPAP
ncbi:Uncharacterized conserved protein, contains ferritin-like DUF455 domain [Sphaerotilus natans]|nr:Uncharacterized conserved protein, contains ferritin-like DUF455 domain [Sphaerotilus natans]